MPERNHKIHYILYLYSTIDKKTKSNAQMSQITSRGKTQHVQWRLSIMTLDYDAYLLFERNISQ